MKYNQPWGIVDPNAAYYNGNPETGFQGSIPPAASIEYPQREIVALIQAAGLTPDDAYLNQLAVGTQSGYMNFASDVGVINAYQVTMAPMPAYRNGLVVRMKANTTNSGQSTLNINAMGPKAIRRKGNVDILANDLTQHSIATLLFNEAYDAFELVGVGGQGIRGELSGPKTLYVNWAIGNDSNDGTANDAGHAVKNCQRAIDIAFSYAPSQHLLTIQIADSQNYGPMWMPGWAGPNISVIGNTSSPASVKLSGGQDHAVVCTGPNNMVVTGVTAQTNTTGTPNPAGCFIASGNSNMHVYNCRSGPCEGAVFEAFNAQLIVGTHTFTGNAGSFFWGMVNGFCSIRGDGIFTFSQPVTVGQTALASQAGLVNIAPNPPPTFVNPGNVTGYRYLATVGGVIGVSGVGGTHPGGTFFPGTIAGTVSFGGVYA